MFFLRRCAVARRSSLAALAPLARCRPAATLLARPSGPRRSFATDKEVITKLLYNIGSKEEVSQYLHHFSSVDSPKFAIIKVGGAVIRDEIDTLASALTFLYRVGLYPIVVHGAGPQLNDLLDAAGIEAKYEDGIRVTDSQTLRIARKVFYEENLKVVEALEALGTRARPIPSGCFVAKYLDKAKYGLVGEIVDVNRHLIESCVRSGTLPILTSLAESEDGQLLNVNADVAASQLAKTLQPLKVIYLNTTTGLLHGETKEKIDTINLDEDYENLMKEPWMKFGTRLKIQEIHDILMHLPLSSSVAITSAAHLSKELFTHSGSGTLIRRGTKVVRYDALPSIDEATLIALSALCRQQGHEHLASPQQLKAFFKTLGKHFTLYTDTGHQSMVVVQHRFLTAPHSVARLALMVSSKGGSFGKVPEAIWSHLTKDVPTLIWAVQKGDPLETWFFDGSDGSVSTSAEKGPPQTVFWRGITDLQQISQFVSSLTATTSLSASAFLPSSSPVAAQPNGKRAFSTFVAQRRAYSTSSGRPIRVGLIGARGHTGKELIQLISGHPDLALTHVSSRELAGKPVPDYKKAELNHVNLSAADVGKLSKSGAVDAWVLALPNNISEPFVQEIVGSHASGAHPVVVDLSADHRFVSSTSKAWTYGLPELLRHCSSVPSLSNVHFPSPTPRKTPPYKRLVANPGCYATAAQLTLSPFLEHLNGQIPPSIVGISGYSGAGTNPSPKNDPKVVMENVLPYSLVNHIHEREVSERCGRQVWFTPCVGGWFRGIECVLQIPLKKDASAEEWEQVAREFYRDEKLVKISKDVPMVKDIANKHYVSIGGFTLSADKRRLVVCATIDNLLKGAATQAVQNLNLALGLEEYAGIPIE